MDEWWDLADAAETPTEVCSVRSLPQEVCSPVCSLASPEVEEVCSVCSPPRADMPAYARPRSEQSSKPPSTSVNALANKPLANGEQTYNRENKPLPAEEIGERLETLLLAIQAGARAGYAVRLPGVNPERVLSLIDVDWPSLDQEQATALLRKAGPVTSLRLLVDDYLYYCHLLDRRGVDTFIERAPLATALAHMPAEARAS